MLQPVKAATPEAAVIGLFVQPDSVAPLGVLIDNVTALLLAVTVLPPASCTATGGCTPKAVPPVAVVLGWVVKASFAAPAAVMFTAVLLPEPAVSATWRLYVPDKSMWQPAKVAAPLEYVAVRL